MLKTHFDSLSFQVPQLIIKVQAGFLQVPITNVPSPNLTTLSTTIDHSKKLLVSFPHIMLATVIPDHIWSLWAIPVLSQDKKVWAKFAPPAPICFNKSII